MGICIDGTGDIMAGIDYVKVSSFLFLKKYKERTGNDSTGVLFNGYMTLLNRELLSRGIDIGLPHCWYRLGDEVVEDCMPFIDWGHEGISGKFVSYLGRSPQADSNDPVIGFVSEFADSFIDRCFGPSGPEEAIEGAYEYVPFRFQNDFRQLRESLKIPRWNGPPHNRHGRIEDLFNKAVSSFPPEFGSIGLRFDEFKSTFLLAMSGNAPSNELFKISETFWSFFCHHLRLNDGCHENVPPFILETWRQELPEEGDKYRMFVENQAARHCDVSVDDPVINTLLRERVLRLKECDSLFTRVFG